MKQCLTVLAVASLALLPGCSRLEMGGKGHYEFTVVKGAKGVIDSLIKLDVSSGAAWYDASNGNALVAVSDNPAPPAGDYHILEWDVPDGSWNAYRYDSESGRVWDLNTQGNPHWDEVPGDRQ
jgi:hypothetical protein